VNLTNFTPFQRLLPALPPNREKSEFFVIRFRRHFRHCQRDDFIPLSTQWGGIEGGDAFPFNF
jgi:hypothetical protein